ncbi:MAG: glycosyltransferase family 9 protein, partial [Terriglobales bacterium]
MIVKLAAAGDVLLTTALAAALRQARPAQPIAWLTTPYAAPLLEHNPDVDEVLLWSGGAGGNWLRLRAWCRAQRPALVLLAHRSLRLQLLLRAAGCGRVVGWRNGRARLGLAAAARFQPQRHRLQLQSDLLAAAGFGGVQARAPRLVLTAAE